MAVNRRASASAGVHAVSNICQRIYTPTVAVGRGKVVSSTGLAVIRRGTDSSKGIGNNDTRAREDVRRAAPPSHSPTHSHSLRFIFDIDITRRLNLSQPLFTTECNEQFLLCSPWPLRDGAMLNCK